MRKDFIILVIIGVFTNPYTHSQCNGANELCDRKYNEIAYLTTHNAFNSSQDNFLFPNQNFNITSQLNDGVRALMIDVYDFFGTPTVYHGSSLLGSSPFLNYLNDIKVFLDNNPNEVISIILECYTSANEIEGDLNQADLIGSLYTHNLGSDWPTLQAMIDSGQRLVIFTDKQDGSPSQNWYHYVWDLAVETHFTTNNISDFSCDYNRGEASNDLFILNHFITNAALGFGEESEAVIVNGNPFLIDRALQCFQEKNKFPNFITLDFYDQGEGLAAVEELNQIILSDLNKEIEKEVSIYPVPSNGIVIIEGDIVLNDLKLCSESGQNVTDKVDVIQVTDSKLSIDITDLSKGLYFIKVKSTVIKVVRK